MNRRTLFRGIAVAVAFAAMSTLLFSAESQAGGAGGLQRAPLHAPIHPVHP
ncbi:MAG TPA: hypothetical protein VJ528_11110 [Geothrix sp.]|nr:hypothetical protein [Geothrix sp.]